jgi:hypothetical protein
MLVDLPTEIIFLIIETIDPFNALRLSSVNRRLCYVVCGLATYWKSYGFRSVEDFISKSEEAINRHPEKLRGLLIHLLMRSSPDVNVQPLQISLDLLETQTIWGIFKMKDSIQYILDPYYAPVVFRHVQKVAERSIMLCVSVGALEVVLEGFQLLDELSYLSGHFEWREELITPLQNTISDAALVGAHGIVKQGITILEDIMRRLKRELDYKTWINPICSGLANAASLGAWNKFEKLLPLLDVIADRGGHLIDYDQWSRTIEQSISRSASLGALDSVQKGYRVLRLLSNKRRCL